MKLDHQLSPYTKINSKCMKGLNIKRRNIKILEGSTGSKMSDIYQKNFTDTAPRGMETKRK